MAHDVQQGVERRARLLDAAVFQILAGDTLLGADDVQTSDLPY
jgi:hypothetical protein